MNDPENQSELQDLLAELAESRLDEGQWQCVKQLLADDEQARQTYLRVLMVESLLERFQVELDTPPVVGQPDVALAPKRAPRGVRFTHTRRWLGQTYDVLSRPTPFSLSVAALVVAVMITAMAFITAPIYRHFAGPSPEPPEYVAPKVVATLTGLDEPQWVAGQTVLQGSHLVAGREMDLESGLAEITFHKGSRVVLQGPAKFVLHTENAGRLANGKLVACVPSSAVGFEVETPTGVIVDLGTEFGVNVRDQHVETHVFVGEVLVKADATRDSQPAAWRLKAGEGLRMETAASVAKFDADRQQFSQRTQFVNIARGKPIVAAGNSWPGPGANDARYFPDKVVDGRIDDSLDSFWIGSEKTPDEHITIDLKAYYMVERVELMQTHNGVANDRGTKDFELWAGIKIGDDRQLVNPVLIADGTLPDAAGTGARLPVYVVSLADGNLAEVKARYLNFVAKTFYGRGAGLNEIRVFGDKPRAATDAP